MDSTSSSASKKRAREPIMDESMTVKKSKPEPYMDILGTEMADIYVGSAPNIKHFHIHKAILCKKIPYFTGMFNSSLKEATENKAEFPDDKWEPFDILYEWVYTGTLRALSTDRVDGKRVLNYSPSGTYLLFDKLYLPGLCDHTVSMYISMSDKLSVLPIASDIATAYTALPPRSKFRRFFLLTLHYIMSGLSRAAHHLKIWPDEQPSNLLLKSPDLCLEYTKLLRYHEVGKEAGDPRKMAHCLFHEHAHGDECPANDNI